MKQRGYAVILLLVAITFFGSIAFLVGSYFSYANKAAEIENLLITKRDDNKNVMAGYSTKIKEIAQTAHLGTDAQMKLIELANKSRYGDSGSKASVSFITEQNPNIDMSLLKNMQQVIEAERTRFTTVQTEMLDIRRSYKTMLSKPYDSFWLHLAGFPKIDFKDFDVISNSYTDKSFEEKRAEAIDLSK